MTGNFEKITLNKSIPISELLLKTLLVYMAKDNYPDGNHNANFSFLKDGVRFLPEFPELKRKRIDFSPIYSIGRKLWICF